MITEAMQRGLIERAKKAAPKEAVGLILCSEPGVYDGPIVDLENVSTTPEETFEVNEEGLDSAVATLSNVLCDLAFWHSHPKSRPLPSKEDIAMMGEPREGMAWIIVGLHPVPLIHVYGWEGKRIVLKEKYQ